MSHRLVPGANLYYQVYGSGPPLLLMSPGHGDADAFTDLVTELSGRYTLLTYDRRGYARSPLDDPTSPLLVATHGDDAAALLADVARRPVDVFASSAGAVVALDLATRYPGRVGTVVAHEPPLVRLLPPGQRPEPPAALEELLRREGPGAAMAQFRAMLGIDLADREPGVDPARSPRAAQNSAFFFAREAPALDRYQPDLEALRGARIVPAAGGGDRTPFPYRCAAALAERLGTPLVEFPGRHSGYLTHPQAFAAQLTAIIGQADD